jgi:hypothetical protein
MEVSRLGHLFPIIIGISCFKISFWKISSLIVTSSWFARITPMDLFICVSAYAIIHTSKYVGALHGTGGNRARFPVVPVWPGSHPKPCLQIWVPGEPAVCFFTETGQTTVSLTLARERKKHRTSSYIWRKNWLIIYCCLLSFDYSFANIQLLIFVCVYLINEVKLHPTIFLLRITYITFLALYYL